MAVSAERKRERDEIKDMLQNKAAALAEELFPAGSRKGNWWVMLSPLRAENNPSFGIRLSGDKAGNWKDFGGAESGDVFGLIALAEGLDVRQNFGAVMQWARAWLGLDGMPPPERKKRALEARKKAEDVSKAAAEEAEQNKKRAFALYLESLKQPFVGSPADFYLQGRGLDVSRLKRLPGALGWLPSSRHVETKTEWPVLTAGMSRDGHRVEAVHRTFLAQECSGRWGKAPVTPARKIWPAFGGAAIYLWRGGSDLSIADAIKHGLMETLVLCEGVEDGLSIALACPELRVWAAGSLGNLAKLRLPPCIDEVIVAADNDWGKPECERQLQAAIQHFSRQGARVRVARSSIGKDANDALLGDASVAHAQPHERGIG